MTDTFRRQLEEEVSTLGLSLSGRQLEQFFQFYKLLTEWNEKMNLTAITEESQVVRKHFTDSLSLVKAVDEKNLSRKGVSLIDVGTGAGFPGIPLKIAFPELKVTLLDSLNKRVKFLEVVCQELGLEQIQAFHGRAEDMGRSQLHRESYDYCVSRAVANLASLCEYCLPFVKTGGCFVSYKSGEIQEELKAGERAAEILGGEVQKIEKFSLPGVEDMRSLIVIAKKRHTPGKYPRKAGLPGKEPLK